MSGKIAGNFFGKSQQEAMDNASTEAIGGEQLTWTGTFPMRVVSKKFKKSDGEEVEFPRFEVAETGTLMLVNILEVTEDVGPVKAGTYTYDRLSIAADEDATEEKRRKIASFCKPRLAAMIGKEEIENFKFTEEWCIENLLSEFDSEENGYKVTKDHNMKNTLSVKFIVKAYQGEPRLEIKSMTEADEGDKYAALQCIEIKEKAKTFADESAADEASIKKLTEDSDTEVVSDDELF